MPGKYSDGRPLIPGGYIVPITGAVSYLTVAGMPDGRVVAVWANGTSDRESPASEIRARIFLTPEAMMFEDPVPASSGTVILSGETYYPCACFVVGDEFFVNVVADDGTSMRNRLYVGDAYDPLGGLALRQDLDSSSSFGGGPLTVSASMGPPTVIGSRWILSTPTISSFQNHAFTRFGVFVSEDGGASFVAHVDIGFYLVGGSYQQGQSTRVMTLPNGDLLVAGWGSVDGVVYARSTDNGASWSTSFVAGEGGMGPYLHYAILNDGVDAYAARHGGGIYKIGNDGLATEYVGPTPGWSHHGNVFTAAEFEVYGSVGYTYFPNRLAVPPSRGWQIGSVAL